MCCFLSCFHSRLRNPGHQLRYQTVNQALVAINGFPAHAHLGNSIRDGFGNLIADQINSRLQGLRATGASSIFEISAILPTRTEPGMWITQFSAIYGAAGKQIGIALVAIEVTELRKLEQSVNQFTDFLLREQSKDNFWLAHELHDSVDEYHSALGMAICELTQKSDRAPELLVETVLALDDRILEMRELVALIANRFPVRQL